MKTILKSMTVASVLTAVVAAAPAEAFSEKRFGHSYSKGHHGLSKRAHRHYSGHHHYPASAHYYGRRFRVGHRPDCVQFKRRAHLTGNAYWQYAYSACRHDYYRKAY